MKAGASRFEGRFLGIGPVAARGLLPSPLSLLPTPSSPARRRSVHPGGPSASHRADEWRMSAARSQRQSAEPRLESRRRAEDWSPLPAEKRNGLPLHGLHSRGRAMERRAEASVGRAEASASHFEASKRRFEASGRPFQASARLPDGRHGVDRSFGIASRQAESLTEASARLTLALAKPAVASASIPRLRHAESKNRFSLLPFSPRHPPFR